LICDEVIALAMADGAKRKGWRFVAGRILTQKVIMAVFLSANPIQPS
jgi:hypothetical protein